MSKFIAISHTEVARAGFDSPQDIFRHAVRFFPHRLRLLTLGANRHTPANIGPLLGLGSFTGSVEIVSRQPIVAVLLNAEAYPVFSSLPPAYLPVQTALADGGN